MFTWTELIKEYEMDLLILGKSKRQIQSSATYVRNFNKYLIANGYAEVQVLPKVILKATWLQLLCLTVMPLRL